MNKIDLSKNQLVEGNVKVRYWDDNKEESEIGYLAIVNHRVKDYPYKIWKNGKKESHYDYDIAYTDYYKNVELIEPKYRVKDFYSLVEILNNQGYHIDKKHCALVSDSIRTNFILKMFKYCGCYVNSDFMIDYYHFEKSWLEEVAE